MTGQVSTKFLSCLAYPRRPSGSMNVASMAGIISGRRAILASQGEQ